MLIIVFDRMSYYEQFYEGCQKTLC